MPQAIKTTVYNFDELSPAAKEKAREWYRDGGFDYDWYDFVYEDAKAIGALLGITISKIYFSGFSSQGDGACFECTFEGKEGSAQAVRQHAPKDETLGAIADEWEKLQQRWGYRLTGTTRQRGHYQHEQCTRTTASISDCKGQIIENDPEAEDYEFDTDDSYIRDNTEPGAEAARILRRFMKWIYRQLEKEWDYQNADEQIDETIRINDYTFTKDGKCFG